VQPEQWTLYKNAVSSSEGAVAAQHIQAAACGADVLASGGNAVDAAVATALMLGVVEPWMCGIGGSGYMVVWDAASKSATVFDFQGVLPQRINRADYPLDPDTPANIMGFPGVVENRNSVGYRAVAVPGAVKGFAAALQRFGSKGLDTLIKPAVAAAEQGVEVNWFTTMQIALAASNLLKDAAASEQFLPHGVPLQPGQSLRMPALSSTMKTLAADGADALYGGALGSQLVADLNTGGSRIEADDLTDYRVIESPALSSVHRGVTVHTAGPTSGGPRLIETLQFIAENLDTGPCTGPGPDSWSVYADALKQAWRSHNQRIGRTTEMGGCTSHLSTVDRDGNMVALTYTLLDRFGAGVLLPQTGLLMNNAVSYFDPRGGYPTSMEGGKRINASNMCPVVATRDDQSVFAVGASGANYIVPCTAMITALMLDFGLTLEQAINAARIDVDGEGHVAADPRLGEDVISGLQAKSNVSIEPLQVFPKRYACPSGVSRDPASGVLQAVGDPSQPFGGGAGV
jgi:gamma-glutamyltranspeptidase/glutathione hydrolase